MIDRLPFFTFISISANIRGESATKSLYSFFHSYINLFDVSVGTLIIIPFFFNYDWLSFFEQIYYGYFKVFFCQFYHLFALTGSLHHLSSIWVILSLFFCIYFNFLSKTGHPLSPTPRFVIIICLFSFFSDCLYYFRSFTSLLLTSTSPLPHPPKYIHSVKLLMLLLGEAQLWCAHSHRGMVEWGFSLLFP